MNIELLLTNPRNSVLDLCNENIETLNRYPRSDDFLNSLSRTFQQMANPSKDFVIHCFTIPVNSSSSLPQAIFSEYAGSPLYTGKRMEIFMKELNLAIKEPHLTAIVSNINKIKTARNLAYQRGKSITDSITMKYLLEMACLAKLAYGQRIENVRKKLKEESNPFLRRYQRVDFIRDPFGSDKKIGFVCSTSTETIISIKGSTCIRDWLFNASAYVDNDVHSGFWGYADSVLESLSNILLEHPRSNSKVTTVGHSLGGAVATVIAHRLKTEFKEYKFKNIKAYTFGAPRVFNSDFQLKIPLYNLQNSLDYVPYLIQRLHGYCDSGKVLLIGNKSKIYNVDSLSENQAFRILEAMSTANECDEFNYLHSYNLMLILFALRRKDISLYTDDEAFGKNGNGVLTFGDHSIKTYIDGLSKNKPIPDSFFRELGMDEDDFLRGFSDLVRATLKHLPSLVFQY